MTKISDRARKQLWGSSVNRCSICKKNLIYRGDSKEKEIILGEECHIISPSSGGPRYDASYPKEKLHSYENLLLLCREHHKIIDNNEEEFTVEKLYQIKKEHIDWINKTLKTDRKFIPHMRLLHPSKSIPLKRIISGKEFVDIGIGSHQLGFDYEEPKNDSEHTAIKHFSSLVTDMDIISDSGISERMDYGKYLTEALLDLTKQGFLVYAGMEKAKMVFDGKDESPWLTFYVSIKRASDSNVADKNREMT